MPLVFGCIAPHGSQALPELTPTPEEGAATRKAMAELGQRLEQLTPDTIIVLTPHGVRIDGAMCISVCERAAGDLGAEVSVDFAVDRPLAEALATASATEGVPVARCIYGASGGPASCIPLDWGAIIPLRHMGHTYQPKPKIVVVCPSRSLSWQQMVAFGRAIGRVAEASPGRVALIASADQGHAHDASGPYGFDRASREYDQQMCDTVRANDLKRLLAVDPALVDAAKCDSHWQTLILAGALEIKPLHGEFLSYEVPSYFGMLCAAYA